MATSFVEDLWSSIFAPGPTPSLLVATNATFAALQVLLFLLLLATYSIHFVVLSFLCAALWWSINWFAREVQAIRAREEVEQRKAQLAEKENHSDSETETEGVSGSRRRRGAAASASNTTTTKSTAAASPAGTAEDGALRERRNAGAESSGYVSTDSEWEKVDGNKSA